MRISRVKIKNWKNFLEVDVELKEKMFIVGANASGKSNFLDVFRFLADITKQKGGGLQEAIASRGKLSKIRCLNARTPSNVEIEIHLSDKEAKNSWIYALAITQQQRGKHLTLLTYEKVWKNGIIILDRPNEEDKIDELLLTQTYLEQINSNKDFREIADFFTKINYLHLVPQLVRNPHAFSGPNLPGDPYGKTFIEKVARTSPKTKRKTLKKIEEVLKNVLPNFKELKEVKDKTGKPHLEAKYEHWRATPAKQQESQFSDGTLRLIGLFWALLENYSILLLEEPELSLNSGIIQRLPSIIDKLLKPNRQIFMSTHSEHLLYDKSISAKEVLILKHDKESTMIKTAANHKEILAMLEGGMTLGDAVIPLVTPDKISQMEMTFNE